MSDTAPQPDTEPNAAPAPQAAPPQPAPEPVAPTPTPAEAVSLFIAAPFYVDHFICSIEGVEFNVDQQGVPVPPALADRVIQAGVASGIVIERR